MDFLPPCESAASHYRVGLVSFGSGCVPVFQGGVFECSSRMKGNFQVRFLEGRVPAMAPGYSTCGFTRVPKLHKPDSLKRLNLFDGNGRFTCRGDIWF